MSHALKTIAAVALPVLGTLVAPGIGTALGSTLGASTLAGIGGALGGAGGGLLNGGGLSGALEGGALGGAGGYLSGGGLSDLVGGTDLGDALGVSAPATSVGSGLTGDFASGAGGAATDDPITQAARSAISDSTASGASAAPTLSGYLPASGGAVAGGGTGGGFLGNVGTDLAGATGNAGGGGFLGLSSSLPSDTSGVGTGLSGQFASGLNPLGSITPAAGAATGGGMLSTNNLLNGLLKTGLSYGLQKNNAGGYGALQGAANQSAANYQPFLTAGTQANNALASLYGLNGTAAAQAATQNWQNTPGYQFALNQGILAQNASDAAKGMADSGNNQQAIQQYGTGLANQYYNQYLGNLQQQAAQGQQAAGGVGSGLTNAATAYAAGKGQQNSAYNTALDGLGNFLFPTGGVSGSVGGQNFQLNSNSGGGGLPSWLSGLFG